MSKLSPSLKALINAPFARPGPCPAPVAPIRDVYAAIAREAAQRHIGPQPWIALSAAATFTLNSPDSLAVLHSLAASSSSSLSSSGDDGVTADAVAVAELIREVGLKCIAFNGIPRTINCLNAFRASLPPTTQSRLRSSPTRDVTPANLPQVQRNGRALWDSVYRPISQRLYDKLSLAHPDLPVHILNGNYGPLLADPPTSHPDAATSNTGRVGRVLTSLVAIASLRAQTGVGPQVVSHVHGLRKSVQDGTWRSDEQAVSAEAVGWLASDEGSEWILKSVDRISEALGGANFGTGRDSKL